jgi:hypothetical protein
MRLEVKWFMFFMNLFLKIPLKNIVSSFNFN